MNSSSESWCCCFVFVSGISNKVISGAPPANALTLEQIHAREDIYPSQYQPPTSTSSVGEGMEAFNKLLAALESKQNASCSLCSGVVL